MTDISYLFDESVPLRTFSLSNIKEIPEYGSIIYTVFLDRKKFIYVGIGGLSGKKDPRSRIRQHTSGIRSGDQFCIYIQDFYVIPLLFSQTYIPKKGHLDQLTKEFIQKRLTYRYMVFQDEDSDKLVRKLEREIQSGGYTEMKPKLNGVEK
jgi:hypothetical protein